MELCSSAESYPFTKKVFVVVKNGLKELDNFYRNLKVYFNVNKIMNNMQVEEFTNVIRIYSQLIKVLELMLRMSKSDRTTSMPKSVLRFLGR